MTSRARIVGWCFVWMAACGGSSLQLDPSFVAVHNTMTAMGLSQSGDLYQGRLAQGEVDRVTTPLRGGECYTVVAFGGEGVADLDVVVHDASGAELAADRTSGSRAAAQVCPTADGNYEVAVLMTNGGGTFVLSSWSGAAGAQGGGGGSGRGTCAAPLPITLGQAISGSTQTASHHMSGTCARPEGAAPEHVYELRLEQRAQVTVDLDSEYDGMLYLLGTCGNPASQIACNDDEPQGNTTHSRIEATLDPGTYFVVVDGYEDAAGSYNLTANIQEMQDVSQVCSSAARLTPGQAVTATTAGQPNYFTATCAGGARSPDRVYMLDVPSRSRVRLRMQSTYDGALHIRQTCTDPNSELACNDDHPDTRHSMLQATLDAGRYYVFADGFSSASQGDYSLRADLAPLTGGNAPADRCAAPGVAQSGRDIELDTFPASDDFAGSCGGAGSPDVVYRVEVTRRSRFRANLASGEFPAALYLRSACDQASTEMVCASGAPGQGATSIDTNLQPGTYFLVVDGTQADVTGAARVEVLLEDLQALEGACQTAPAIRPGRTIQGDTSSSQDRFQATCAGNARSADLVYRLVLPRRSHVRITSEQQFDGALYIRRDCTDMSTEVACNDDSTDNHHSLLEATLDQGTYFVFVDGFADRNQGSFTMDVEVTRP